MRLPGIEYEYEYRADALSTRRTAEQELDNRTDLLFRPRTQRSGTRTQRQRYSTAIVLFEFLSRTRTLVPESLKEPEGFPGIEYEYRAGALSTRRKGIARKLPTQAHALPFLARVLQIETGHRFVTAVFPRQRFQSLVLTPTRLQMIVAKVCCI